MSKARIIRLSEALHRTGFIRSSWYRSQARHPDAPKPVKLGARCVGYLEADVDAFIERLTAHQ